MIEDIKLIGHLLTVIVCNLVAVGMMLACAMLTAGHSFYWLLWEIPVVIILVTPLAWLSRRSENWILCAEIPNFDRNKPIFLPLPPLPSD